MPNYVEMDLFINGEQEELKRFLAGLKRNEAGLFSVLNSYYPMPDDIAHTSSPDRIVTAEEKTEIIEAQKDQPDGIKIYAVTQEEYNALVAKYGVGNWYDWSRKFWGSKWGDFEGKVESDEDDPWDIEISCKAAWSPPAKGFAQVAKLFPELRFSLYSYERGMEFMTGHEWENGELIETWQHKYHGNRGG